MSDSNSTVKRLPGRPRLYDQDALNKMQAYINKYAGNPPTSLEKRKKIIRYRSILYYRRKVSNNKNDTEDSDLNVLDNVMDDTD